MGGRLSRWTSGQFLIRNQVPLIGSPPFPPLSVTDVCHFHEHGCVSPHHTQDHLGMVSVVSVVCDPVASNVDGGGSATLVCGADPNHRDVVPNPAQHTHISELDRRP